MSKLSLFWRQSWLLIVSSFLFGLLIAGADAAFGPRIRQNEEDKRNRSMRDVVSGAVRFVRVSDPVRITRPGAKDLQTEVYTGQDEAGRTVGFAFEAEGTGFGGTIRLIVGADASMTRINGFKVLSASETAGFGDEIGKPDFADQFKGAPAGILELVKVGDKSKIDDRIVAITGATISSQAVVGCLNSYLPAVKEQLHAKGVLSHGQ